MAMAEEQSARARSFAAALLSLAGEGDRADAVASDLAALAGALASSADFVTLANSPEIRPEAKSEAVGRVFSGRVDELTMRFVHVLARHDALGLLSVMAEQFAMVRDAQAGRVKVEVTTAIALTNGSRSEVAIRLASALGAKIVLQDRVDPSLIGGMVVRVGDTLFDGSVRRQLDQLREQVIARGNHEIQIGRNLLAD